MTVQQYLKRKSRYCFTIAADPRVPRQAPRAAGVWDLPWSKASWMLIRARFASKVRKEKEPVLFLRFHFPRPASNTIRNEVQRARACADVNCTRAITPAGDA